MENKAVIIDLKNISISFDDQPILKDVSLEIHDGEFVTLLGPSGCGKTTTLRIIAGFLSPDSGDVIFEGKKINGVPAHKRQVNTIFQRYALFPNLNVADNIAFGLKLQKKSKSEIKKITEAFYMIDKSRARKEGGAGIGMSLCKKIVSIHNAKWSVRSKPGKGTIISIVFQEGQN